MTLTVNGDSAENSHASIRWGTEDFDKHEYFPRWDVMKGTRDTKEFDTSDDNTEFEVQTQGGAVTGYSLIIEINGKEAIICKFNARPAGTTLFENKDVVRVVRSGALNAFGEGNLRVLFNGTPNPGPIPSS